MSHVDSLGYVRIPLGASCQWEHEHILIAEKALGRSLPNGVQVHHVDGKRDNNSPSNLVICPSDSYHKLLHQRTAAFDESGHADWRLCRFCRKYDDPKNLYIGKGMSCYHRSCYSKHRYPKGD